jgi:hypothetical protein
MADTGVHFNRRAVEEKLDEAMAQIAARIAFRLEWAAKRQIRANDQIDTSFMVNSVYSELASKARRSAASRDYETSKAAAESRSARGGHKEQGRNKKGQFTKAKPVELEREMAPKVELKGDELAAVAVGARYAIYQEQRKPFLFPAAEQVKGEMADIVTEVRREVLND